MRKKSAKTLKLEAWRAFARYIKARDAQENGFCSCITCGKVMVWDSKDVHAGHFVGGRGNAVLFDEEVVSSQCVFCNLFRSGEQAKYALALKKRFGYTDEQIEELLNRRHKIVKYKPSDYARISEEYNNKADAIIALKRI